MVSLSELLHFQVIDAYGGRKKLTDLVISQLDVDYPPVTHLIVRSDTKNPVVFPWKLVKSIEMRNRQIQIENYKLAEDIHTLGQAVRLKWDVLDALLLDLQNRRVTRANDLWLEEKDNQLLLSAADTGAWAILRRLGSGWLKGRGRKTLTDWKYIEFLRGDPGAVEAGAGYYRRIVRLPPGEIAHLATAMPYLHAAELLELLPVQLAADTLEVMSLERQLQVFEELDEETAVQILQHMAPDLAADIVGRIDTSFARQYLNSLPRDAGMRIVDLLRYPENSVGGIMANDVITLPPKIKVRQAREILRDKLKDPDFVYFIYVVDEQAPHRLRGVLSLRQILLAGEDEIIEQLMNPYLITLSPFDSPDVAGYRLLNSQLAALPVIGSQGQLLGTVTIDAAVSQVAPRSWRARAPRVFS